MEYVKGSPIFCDVKERLKQYPYLDHNIECEILIVGGGIDGAIANFFLSKNHDVILVDKARIGFGCTSCATALLEYQLDDFAKDIEKFLSEDETVSAYKMGLASIDKIKKFVDIYKNKCNFHLRPTFLYTNSIFSIKSLEDEYAFRLKHGFKCDLITQENNPFPFPVKFGIFCEDGGCEFNPYLFTKQMIENAKNQKNIFENTKIEKIVPGKNILAVTNYGHKIRCEKLVLATGFNFEVLGEKSLCERFVSFSIATKPIKTPYYKKCLIHDAEEPYHYLRTLADGGLIFGGEDVPLDIKTGLDENTAQKKYESLEKDLKTLFPDEELEITHKFCGAFGTTNNNLGVIGESEIKNIYYFISCGANGIINAMFGAQLLEDTFHKKQNPLTKAFSPLRESL